MMSNAGTPDRDKFVTPLRLTVFGANGGTGAAAVEQALAVGHSVTAVTRHPEQFSLKHDRLTVFKGDATVPADVRAAIEGRMRCSPLSVCRTAATRSPSTPEALSALWTP